LMGGEGNTRENDYEAFEQIRNNSLFCL